MPFNAPLATEMLLSFQLTCQFRSIQLMVFLGHTRKMRKRHKLQRRSIQQDTMDDSRETGSTTVDDGPRYSSRGGQIRTPAKFLVVDIPETFQEERV